MRNKLTLKDKIYISGANGMVGKAIAKASRNMVIAKVLIMDLYFYLQKRIRFIRFTTG